MSRNVSAERARELLSYDPETGELRWRIQANSRAPKGARAGSINNGYRRIKIDGRDYLAHRLAWLIVKGAWPSNGLDHRNGDGSDNRWINLREATVAQNQANVGRRVDNTSGFKGVHRRAEGGRWVASISVAGKRRHLGSFRTPQAAYAAYLSAARAARGSFERAE